MVIVGAADMVADCFNARSEITANMEKIIAMNKLLVLNIFLSYRLSLFHRRN
jgi:hypothetical protein